MRSIFIGSTGGGPGQTLATWALAVRLKEKGLKVGFFKPYGLLPESAVSSPGTLCDPEVPLFKEVLGISDPDEILCPISLPESQGPAEIQGEELMGKIQKAFREASRGKDVVLIIGGKEIFFGEGGPGLSDGVLVKSFESSVLLVDRYQRDNLTFYSVLSLNSFLDGRVKSAILNHVPPEKMDHVKTKVVSFLQQKGVRSAVAVPEDPVLAALTVSSIADLTRGEILCCAEGERNLVQTSTIGAKYLEGPFSLFKQVYNKVILVGLNPDETPVTGIILTGGKNPSEGVVKVAQDRGIPLILTRADTFQVMDRLEKAKPALTFKDEFKVQRFLTLIDEINGGSRWVEELL
ncbi:MAG: DRTGG domain-containing protein [Planctomycetaceae bacterium]